MTTDYRNIHIWIGGNDNKMTNANRKDYISSQNNQITKASVSLV